MPHDFGGREDERLWERDDARIEQKKIVSKFTAHLISGGDLHEVIIRENEHVYSYAGNVAHKSEDAIRSAIANCADNLEDAQRRLIKAQAEVSMRREILEAVKALVQL